MEPYKYEHMKKEFIMEMQAKGKLPRFLTDASDRFDKSYYETAPRIFPGPGGMNTVLQNMMSQAEKRIDAVTEHLPAHYSADTACMAAAAQSSMRTQQQEQHRHHIKAKMHLVEKSIKQERSQRHATEARLHVQQEAAQLLQAPIISGMTLQERLQAQGKLPLYPHQQPAAPLAHSPAPVQQSPPPASTASSPSKAPAASAVLSHSPSRQQQVHGWQTSAASQVAGGSQVSDKRSELIARERMLRDALKEEQTARRQAEAGLASLKMQSTCS